MLSGLRDVLEELGGGRSRALLGRSWGGLEVILEAISSPDDFRSILGPSWPCVFLRVRTSLARVRVHISNICSIDVCTNFDTKNKARF